MRYPASLTREFMQTLGAHPLLDASLSKRAHDGLGAAEFHVVYQPVIHHATRKLAGIECFLRWRHPDYGLLLPDTFAPAFDDTDFAFDATRFMLESACRQYADARKRGHAVPRITLEVSCFQLIDDRLVALIGELTRSHDMDPAVLELAVAGSEEASKLLATYELIRPLTELGVRIALDQFGSGYSSLGMLASANIDTIKLAPELLAKVPHSARACTILEGMLDLIATLDIAIVVEGVDTPDQLNWLEQFEHVCVQGYYLGMPETTIANAIEQYRLETVFPKLRLLPNKVRLWDE